MTPFRLGGRGLLFLFFMLALATAALGIDVSTCSQLKNTGANYILTSDITSVGRCFNITADWVNFDCQNKTITLITMGTSPIEVIGINGSNILVQNCNFLNANANETVAPKRIISAINSQNITLQSNSMTLNFKQGGVGSYGIYFSNTSNSLIQSNYIWNNMTPSNNIGIYIEKSYNDTIASNSIITNQSTVAGAVKSNNTGIFLWKSNYSNLFNNDIVTAGDAKDASTYQYNNGINGYYSDLGIIQSNKISVYGTGTVNSGISQWFCQANNITKNNVTTATGSSGLYLIQNKNVSMSYNNITSDSVGITLSVSVAQSTGNANVIVQNRINTTNDGISMIYQSNCLIKQNYINSGINGISMTNTSSTAIMNNNTIKENLIFSNIKASGAGIYIQQSYFSEGFHNIEGNNITANMVAATCSDNALYLFGSSYNNITGNMLRANCSNSLRQDNYAVKFTASTNNIFTNNTFYPLNKSNALGIVTTPSFGMTFNRNIFWLDHGAVAHIASNWLYGLTFYDNIINTTNTSGFSYGSNQSNFSLTMTLVGTNIVGGNIIGGNYYANSSSGGQSYSELCTDADFNGVCDSPNVLNGNVNMTDFFPLSRFSSNPVANGSVSFIGTGNNGSASTTYFDVVGWHTEVVAVNKTLDWCWFQHNNTGTWTNTSKALCGGNDVLLSAPVQITQLNAYTCGQFGTNLTNGTSYLSPFSCFSSTQGTLTVNVFDESGNSIGAGIQATVSSLYIVNQTTMTGHSTTYTLSPALYAVDLGNATYPTRRYLAAVYASQNTVLNAYLLANTTGTGHYITVTTKSSEGGILANSTLEAFKFIGTDFQPVETRLTDFSGSARFFVDSTVEYKFIASHPGYITKVNTFFPTDLAYIMLLSSDLITNNSIYNFVTYSTSEINCSQFIFVANSPSGIINSMWLFVQPNASDTFSDLSFNAHGATLVVSPDMNPYLGNSVKVSYLLTAPGYDDINITHFCRPESNAPSGVTEAINQVQGLPAWQKYVITSILAMMAALAVAEFAGGMLPAAAGLVVIVAAGIVGFIPGILAGMIAVLAAASFLVLGRGGE